MHRQPRRQTLRACIAPELNRDHPPQRLPLFPRFLEREREREREREFPLSSLCGLLRFRLPCLRIYRVRVGFVACAIACAVRFLKAKHAEIFRCNSRDISTTNEQPFTGNRHPYLRSCPIAAARYPVQQGVPLFSCAYPQVLHRLREPGKAVRLQNGRRHAYPVEEVCA